MGIPTDPIKRELWRQRQSAAQRGQKKPKTAERNRTNNPMWNPQSREKARLKNSGENHHFWGIKGKDNPNFGKRRSEETKQQMRAIQKARATQPEYIPPMQGKHQTEEFKENMRGDKNPAKRPEVRAFLSEHSSSKDPQVAAKISESHKGDKNPAWKGGITPLQKTIRKSFEYRSWVLAVFERDKFTCQKCKKIGGKLTAHHKKQFAQILEENHITTFDEALACAELWDVDNGITFCEKCHKVEHKEQGKKKGGVQS